MSECFWLLLRSYLVRPANTHCMCLYGFFESNSKVWSVVVVCGGHLSFLGPRNSPMMDIVVFLCSANRQQCVLWLTVCSWWTTSNIPLNACAHSYQKPWNSSNFAVKQNQICLKRRNTEMVGAYQWYSLTETLVVINLNSIWPPICPCPFVGLSVLCSVVGFFCSGQMLRSERLTYSVIKLSKVQKEIIFKISCHCCFEKKKCGQVKSILPIEQTLQQTELLHHSGFHGQRTFQYFSYDFIEKGVLYIMGLFIFVEKAGRSTLT